MRLQECSLSILNGLLGRVARNSLAGLRRGRQEPHKVGEFDYIAQHLRAGQSKVRGIFRRVIVEARGRRVGTLVWKQLIGDAHFHVVSLARKNLEWLVLRLPPKSRDASVVAA